MSGSTPIGGISHVIGATDVPLIAKTIPDFLSETVASHGDRTAVVCCAQSVRRTYSEFAHDVDSLARGLLNLGLEPGDRIGIWSPNRYEWVLTQFATARLGLILVNINPAYRLSELDYALNKVGCRALVTAESFKSSNYIEMIQTLAPELETCAPGALKSERFPNLDIVVTMGDVAPPGMMRFEDLVLFEGDTEALDAVSAQLSPDDAINIQFTSGTTGRPKGATLTHANIINNARFVTDRINLTEIDKLCIPVPLYHCFGMVMGVLGVIGKGAAMVFPGEAFDPEETLDALASEACTALYSVPTMFLAMLQSLDQTPRDLSALRTGVAAGALVPVEVMRAVQSRMNMTEITICYGMTETSPVSFQSFTDDPLDKRCETVGRVHPHIEVKIVDNKGKAVAIGETGELCTKGYSVMLGYWDDEDKTQESIRDGWMMTGDLAKFDADGFCIINGRSKDMIIRGGENIYPREIEEFLIAQADVADAQVFGVPDAHYGEAVCAWVIPAPGTRLGKDDVKRMCKGQIAHFKIPKHVRIVESFPMTVTGKPQKFLMQNAMVQHIEDHHAR